MVFFRNKTRRLCGSLFICNLVLIVFILRVVLAQESKNTTLPAGEVVILSHTLDLNFVAEEAFFIIEMENSVRKVKAVMVPPFGQDEPNTGGGKWHLGAFLQVPAQLTSLKYSVLVRGVDKYVEYVPNVSWELNTQNTFSGSVELLKGYLNQRRQVLRSWQAQMRVQDESLKRLRADADIIAQVGKIVEVKEEVDSIKGEINSLSRDAEVMHEFLKQVRNQAQPKNFSRREIDLTKQISELVQVVKSAEAGEGHRRKKSQSELDKKLALLEETRLDDEDNLRSELASLRARRIKLENASSSTPDDKSPSYWDVQ